MGFLDFGPYRFTKDTGYLVRLNECSACGEIRAHANHEEGGHNFSPLAYQAHGRMGELPETGATFDQKRLNWAIKSIQKRLVIRNFLPDDFKQSGVYNFKTKEAVSTFQRDEPGLQVDGVAGTQTIRRLFSTFVAKKTEEYELDDDILCGLIMQESGFDPAATGAFNSPTAGTDRGLVQLNSIANPDITDAQAFDAAFSIDLGGKRLKARFDALMRERDDDPELAWNCAIAAHNSPADAAGWWETGEPPDDQIRGYVGLIRSHCS